YTDYDRHGTCRIDRPGDHASTLLLGKAIGFAEYAHYSNTIDSDSSVESYQALERVKIERFIVMEWGREDGDNPRKANACASHGCIRYSICSCHSAIDKYRLARNIRIYR